VGSSPLRDLRDENVLHRREGARCVQLDWACLLVDTITRESSVDKRTQVYVELGDCREFCA
jgi:hypothetical protein